MKFSKSIFIIAIALFIMNACNKEDGDTTPPGKLEVTGIIPTHGGAKIAYHLPGDNDVLFVKAKYTNSLGNEVFKVASFYNDTIEVDGFNDTLPKQIELFVVDRNNNQSESVTATVTPLISFIYLVQQSIQIESDLGGVKVSWENISEKTVHVYLYYKYANIDTSQIVSSQLRNYSYNLIGLDSVEYEFSADVEDFAGNKTGKKFIGTATPKYEEKIDKQGWRVVSNLSVDGNAWEGATVNFWDDVIDTHEDPNDNSYFIINRDANGGALNYPLDIVIDLNKVVIIDRFVVWQRAYWYSSEESQGISALPYYYQQENMRSFELYSSNDKENWTLIGAYDIGDPKDADGNVPPAAIQEALDGHKFNLAEVSEAFRYLKFSITSTFGSEINCYGSEITLYGLDHVSEIK